MNAEEDRQVLELGKASGIALEAKSRRKTGAAA
jgi:hypothetical protein